MQTVHLSLQCYTSSEDIMVESDGEPTPHSHIAAACAAWGVSILPDLFPE